jgi:K+-transporting ATPase A subunit
MKKLTTAVVIEIVLIGGTFQYMFTHPDLEPSWLINLLGTVAFILMVCGACLIGFGVAHRQNKRDKTLYHRQGDGK